MITLLARLLIKNREDTQNAAVRRAWGSLVSGVSLFFNMLLVLLKMTVGHMAGSLAIQADAMNNLSDAVSTGVVLFGFRLAAKKPTGERPFGHGRIEYVVGMIVSVTVMMLGAELFFVGMKNIISPKELLFSVPLTLCLSASILVKLYMAVYNASIAKKLNSSAMRAVSKDSLSDMAATLLVLLSCVIYHITDGKINIDGWSGAAIALLILWTGYKSLKETVTQLLGQRPDPELVAQIEEKVLSHPEVIGIHDLIIHDYGPCRFMVSLHAEVSGEGDVYALHDTMEGMIHDIEQTFGCEAVVHIDPVRPEDEKTRAYRKEVTKAVEDINAAFSVHDFRVVEGRRHTNLIFEVLVPWHVKERNEEIEKKIYAMMAEKWADVHAIIKIERPYV